MMPCTPLPDLPPHADSHTAAARFPWVLALALCLSALPQPGASAPALPPAEVYTHVAQPGDTLIGLGERLLSQPADWPQLQRLNRIADPRRIPVGQAVRIPVALLRHVPRDAEVITVSGQARLKPAAGAEQVAQVGMRWAPGGQIQTGPDGFVTVKLADGSLLRIQSSTKVNLQQSRHYEAPGFFSNLLQVIQGRIEAAVAHLTGGEPRFQVRTPQATVGVRGTDFRVAADATEQTSQSEVLTGRVALRSERRTDQAELSAGQGARVDAQARVSPPTPLPQPPALDALPTLHERPLVRLNLPPQSAATRYRAQVAADAQFQDVRAEVVSSAPELRIAGLPDGLWHLRVRSIDGQGLEGPDATRTFTLAARPEPPQPMAPAPGAKHRGLSLPLRWAQPDEAAAFRLQVSTRADFQGPLQLDQRVTTTQHPLPLPQGTWHWRLASLTGAGRQGPWGDTQTAHLLPPPADVPAPTLSETHLSFRWPAEAGQTHLLQMARDRDFQQQLTSVHVAKAEAELPRPPEGGTWWVRVQSTDPDGYVGPFSSPQKITLPGCTADREGQCLRAMDGSVVRGRP
ncbi:hypothetical protein EYS42_06285 [Aquabacterium lacunae]|uniref:LysM domain-containing protein n=1 Tax=Aquabacterium lacunae TaxID=2528630 RepID=A0A4Q9H0H0_9BURK|nr:FecR domain-containing protein [Aquabacterium lacunae]TBO32779.1 hypothetical protein EYS42_06285 [Aquabacterium lacunae]